MTIGKKLMLAFGAMLAFMLILAYSDLSSISSLGNLLEAEIGKTAKQAEIANALTVYAYQMRSTQRGVVLYSLLKDQSGVEQNQDAFRAGSERLEKAISDLRPILRKPAARGAVDAIQTDFDAWMPLYQQIQQFSANQRFDADFSRVVAKTAALNNDIESEADKLRQVQSETQAEEAQNASAAVSSSRWIAFLLICLTVLVGAATLWGVHGISSSLRRFADELGKSAEQTASAASQVSSSSQSLARGSAEQASSLEETSASNEEINSMAHKNSENSRSAAEIVTASQEKFVETNRALGQMVTAMAEIKTSSDKISKIIKTIDEIAFQTNILALNAAVEAARAGEAGMGFAVVADEVRNLAQRCAQAAKDTADLIEESIAKSNDGKAKVDQVAVSIRAVTEHAGTVKTLVDEVSVASEEQARGIDQIGKAITQMERVTQKTAASAEQSAAAAEELTAQSVAMKDAIQRLTSLVGSVR